MSAIRVALTLPVLRIGLGGFSVDPVEHLVGAKISDLLEPLMTGPRTERRNPDGVRVDVYPLALPEGEGASIPFGSYGELGAFNDGGRLVLTVPVAAAPWVVARLGSAVLDCSRATGSRAVAIVVSLRPGSRAALPLGALGEVGIEAA